METDFTSLAVGALPSERDKAPGRQFRLMNVLTVRTHFLGQERLSQDASLYDGLFNSNKIFWINQNYQEYKPKQCSFLSLGPFA